MGTYSPDPEIAELRQRWLARERRARAANASFAVGEGGDFVEPTYAYDSPEDLAARHAEIIRQIEEHRRRVGDAATSPSEVWDAGAEFGPADRSALAGAASWASQFGTSTGTRPRSGLQRQPLRSCTTRSGRTTNTSTRRYRRTLSGLQIERSGRGRSGLRAMDLHRASRLRQWMHLQADSSAPVGSTSAGGSPARC